MKYETIESTKTGSPSSPFPGPKWDIFEFPGTANKVSSEQTSSDEFGLPSPETTSSQSNLVAIASTSNPPSDARWQPLAEGELVADQTKYDLMSLGTYVMGEGESDFSVNFDTSLGNDRYGVYTAVIGNDENNVIQGGGLWENKKNIEWGSSDYHYHGDYIAGGAGNDTIYGHDGNDSLWGEEGHDNIYGGTGNDYISGGQGNDNIYGESGDDNLHGGDGSDEIYGGDGNDDLYGEAGNDRLFGGNGNDYINGHADDDYLEGNSGNDTLNGDDGDDELHGGAGDDVLNGGYGNDILFGDDNNDRLYGSSGNDELFGGAGDDELWGGLHNDFLDGGAGNDSLRGEGGQDTLKGGDGADTLNGGSNDDVLTGGKGADVFVFEWNFNHDVITDYEAGVDQLHFRGADMSDLDFTLTPDGFLISAPGGYSVLLQGVDAVDTTDFVFF